MINYEFYKYLFQKNEIFLNAGNPRAEPVCAECEKLWICGNVDKKKATRIFLVAVD